MSSIAETSLILTRNVNNVNKYNMNRSENFLFFSEEKNEPLRFYISKEIKNDVKDKLIDAIEKHGGQVVEFPSKIELVKKNLISLTSLNSCIEKSYNLYSYQYVYDSIKKNKLLDLIKYVVPVKEKNEARSRFSGRTRFTQEDDEALLHFINSYPKKQLGGQIIYRTLESINQRHSAQAWRERYMKYWRHVLPQYRPEVFSVDEIDLINDYMKSNRLSPYSIEVYRTFIKSLTGDSAKHSWMAWRGIYLYTNGLMVPADNVEQPPFHLYSSSDYNEVGTDKNNLVAYNNDTATGNAEKNARTSPNNDLVISDSEEEGSYSRKETLIVSNVQSKEDSLLVSESELESDVSLVFDSPKNLQNPRAILDSNSRKRKNSITKNNDTQNHKRKKISDKLGKILSTNDTKKIMNVSLDLDDGFGTSDLISSDEESNIEVDKLNKDNTNKTSNETDIEESTNKASMVFSSREENYIEDSAHVSSKENDDHDTFHDASETLSPGYFSFMEKKSTSLVESTGNIQKDLKKEIKINSEAAKDIKETQNNISKRSNNLFFGSESSSDDDNDGNGDMDLFGIKSLSSHGHLSSTNEEIVNGSIENSFEIKTSKQFGNEAKALLKNDADKEKTYIKKEETSVRSLLNNKFIDNGLKQNNLKSLVMGIPQANPPPSSKNIKVILKNHPNEFLTDMNRDKEDEYEENESNNYSVELNDDSVELNEDSVELNDDWD